MLVAGPNLTIDRTLAIAELRPGEVLRFDRVVVTPGGKGLNVARAAHALGHPAVLVSLVPGHTGRAAAALIADEDMDAATRADVAQWTGCIAGALTRREFEQALAAAGLTDIEIRETHRVHAHAASAIVRATKP